MIQQNGSFGPRLRAERLRLGLTQAQAAVVGKVSKTTQVAYETDARIPDLEYVRSLSEAGFDEVFLLTGQHLSKSFDWRLMSVLVDAVMEWSQEHGVRIPRPKLEDLLCTLYSQFENAEDIDPAALNRTLRLIS
ncbi:helix-turn-helix domain-containing protein [Uliginosibacterium gangwonense]|uniref:helix-turn-helix domain-containing protein n=1 Tax=Uliginosibacterium gangwonense TaxID=392736 RepID=UPI000370D983|nr:helix-turn-helix transcriptional regulator [Uliginosibacterium gangwonense]